LEERVLPEASMSVVEVAASDGADIITNPLACEVSITSVPSPDPSRKDKQATRSLADSLPVSSRPRLVPPFWLAPPPIVGLKASSIGRRGPRKRVLWPADGYPLGACEQEQP
jgi:hypothetical protein